ncbi:MAG: hypothetical protein HY423_15260 [Candidatus Lambdaproteobacteria bacterium]|nr:hypothetical protein [Candidatus Lambdaproteobacteria bacterium]
MTSRIALVGIALLLGLPLPWLACAPAVRAQGQPSAAPAGRAPAAGERPRIAVLPFQRAGISPEDANAVEDKFSAELVKLRVFRVLTRTEISSVLKEQVFQQQGLTEQEQAVTAGKLLNAKYIVTGRINFLRGAYQLNAQLITVQTAEIVGSESELHRGDFLDMIERTLPSIAQRLAQAEKGPAAPLPTPVVLAAPPPPPATAAPKPPGAARRVALYPFLIEGGVGANIPQFQDRLAERLAKKVQASLPPGVEVSTEMALPAAREKFEHVASNAWTGVFNKEPDQAFVFRTAKELGHDLVVMLKLAAQPGGGEFEVHLLDVARLRHYREQGSWQRGRLEPIMEAGMQKVLAAYRADR